MFRVDTCCFNLTLYIVRVKFIRNKMKLLEVAKTSSKQF